MTAITTELGRNSASIQYGPSATGADLFTTLQSVDAWMRNDTWAGYATASSTTVTGFGTVWNTVAKAGDYIMIAGQQRVILSVVSDNAITVTQAFSPAITIASAVRVINNAQPTAGTLTGVGAAGSNVRGGTTGTVYVTNGSTVINGVGTFFLSECTSSVVPVAVNGTVAVDTSGNITGTGTTFITGADGTPQRLQPGDCIAVLSAGQTYYMIVSSVTSDTAATVTAATIPSTAITAGATISKALNGFIGRVININGRVRTITGIGSNSQLTVNAAMDFTDSNLKLKVYPRGLVSNGFGFQSFGTTLSNGTGTNLYVGGTITTGTFIQAGAIIQGGGGSSPAGTYIVNQQYSTGTSVASSAATGGIGSNILSVASTASLAVGLLVQGNAAALAGVPASTHIIAINGLNLTLSNPLTASWVNATAYFYAPGGAGVYTVSASINWNSQLLTLGQINGVGTNFFWDLGSSSSNFTGITTSTSQQSSLGDQVLFGDEIRTIRFNSLYNATTASSIAYITDYTNYTSATPVGLIRQSIVNAPFKRDCSFIFASTATFTTDIRTGDDLIIDGTEVTVSQVISDTQLKLTNDFPSNPTGNSVIYKKLKLHGYTLEGTREGGPLSSIATKWSNSGTITVTTGTVFAFGTSTITVALAPVVNSTFNFIKVTGAGGPPKPITGQATFATSTVTGVGTAFTSELYIGAEIVIAGQYLTVSGITSDTLLTVWQVATPAITAVTPIYRSIPLYTYISNISGTTITLGATTENALVSTGGNPPQVWYPQTGGDYIEFVYSAPNYYAEVNTGGTTATNTVLNGSYDRKYVGFRFWPLFQGTVMTPSASNSIATANGAYSMPVYERWAASYGGAGGVGINQADLSGGLMSSGTQALFVYTLNFPIAGSVTTATSLTTAIATGIPLLSYGLASGTAGLSGSTYTLSASQSVGVSNIVHSLNGVYDITSMTQVAGGFLYLFATRRYVIIQGKSNANVQTQWVGCIEFERAQPEDISGTSGLGTTQGVSFTAYGGTQLAQGASPPNQSTAGYSQAIQYTPGVAPWPTYAYVNGNRFPTGSMQTPTLPVLQSYPIHGGLFSVPRVRNSAGDLVGINAHVYSAATITTGRWGHQTEFGNYGTYFPSFSTASPTAPAASIMASLTANAIPQIHLGQILPVYTNVYNSKRFMFSPVVVLGPAYDPDIRGRFFGMKVIPSGLGTLLDTVSITTNANTYFYDSTQAAVDHWVIGTPPTGVGLTSALPGQTQVQTMRFTTLTNTAQIQQSWRSLEDTTQQATNAATNFTNNFRMAVPA